MKCLDVIIVRLVAVFTRHNCKVGAVSGRYNCEVVCRVWK